MGQPGVINPDLVSPPVFPTTLLVCPKPFEPELPEPGSILSSPTETAPAARAAAPRAAAGPTVSLAEEVDWALTWGEASPDPPVDCTQFLTSGDPNEMIGPPGPSRRHWLNGRPTTYTYTAQFENMRTASGAAYQVVVTDKLDRTKLALGSLALGSVTFGTHVLTPPAGAQHWTGSVDLGTRVVTVTAGLDPAGTLSWRFTTADAATGAPITDPTEGFLPPDTNPPEGDGSVTFSVRPAERLPSGARVVNAATIVFDTNAAISTAPWTNTIDRRRPTSRITHVTRGRSRRHARVLHVRWRGRDRGSGIDSFDVYAKLGSARSRLWLLHTSSRRATFVCRPGRTYRFSTVAEDAAGNRQAGRSTLSRAVRCR